MKRTGWIGGLLAAAVLLGGAPGYQAATGAAADMETPLETLKDFTRYLFTLM